MGDQTQPFGGQPAPDDSEAATSISLGPGVKLKDRYVIDRELGRGGSGDSPAHYRCDHLESSDAIRLINSGSGDHR